MVKEGESSAQRVDSKRRAKVAILGGGIAALTTAFELSDPKHNNRYDITVYQMGWRLGGKGASGRGPAGRIEEHGLHVWLGFYENAFRVIRACYAELGYPGDAWREIFFPESRVGLADMSNASGQLAWTTLFPPGAGMPGDPLEGPHPFTMAHYFARSLDLLRALLLGLQTHYTAQPEAAPEGQGPYGATGIQSLLAAMQGVAKGVALDGLITDGLRLLKPGARWLVGGQKVWSADALLASIMQLLQPGALASITAMIEGLALAQVAASTLPNRQDNEILQLIERLLAGVRNQLEEMIDPNDKFRLKWEILDIVMASVLGVLRDGLLFHPDGFDAVNHVDLRAWLRGHGASERSLQSAYLRGMYDLAFAYEEGDHSRPSVAAGQSLRASVRMLFTYRGALFWKMRASMGEVVFAPLYRLLSQRGVRFRFFHRLRHVRLAPAAKLREGESSYVERLEFDVQAQVHGGKDYDPIVTVNGIESWPSQPDFTQLMQGERLRNSGVEFESPWDAHVAKKIELQVGKDFDLVVLAVGGGAVEYVCEDFLRSNPQWWDMAKHMSTVATRAFQLWMNEDMSQLGWEAGPLTLSAFKGSFDTWADMGHIVASENWAVPPKAVAYFCSVLKTSDDSLAQCKETVRLSAIHFLNNEIGALWPKAVLASGNFRWRLLVDAAESTDSTHQYEGEERFRTQYWTANIYPSDRYVQSLPGSIQYRISPLDDTYDNLTIAGDWTDCRFNEGCVEAAVMSGLLAAHAISNQPPLEDIIGYNHP